MNDIAAVVNYLFWISVLLSITGVLLVPVLAVRIPADYFSSRRRQPSRLFKERSAWGLLVLVLRNAMALLLIAAGIVMLFTPGQGVLMLLVALSLASFPGKRAIERKLIALPGVLDTINSLRAKAREAPLDLT